MTFKYRPSSNICLLSAVKFLVINLLLICAVQTPAQVLSSHDGFYEADSLFYQLSGKNRFKFCVNCYSPDSLHTYTGGVWLYSRQHAPNTWENSQFSRSGSEFNAGAQIQDTSNIRANVVKTNTVWVRIYNDTGYTDEHHFVFLGNWKPKTPILISILVDSSDLMGQNGFYGPGKGMSTVLGYLWNYRLSIEKKCSYQVLGGTYLKPEVEQTAGVEISGNWSANYPNKGFQLNANMTTAKNKMLSLGESLTHLLGPDVKILRFRVGGANHQSNILANEIAMDIISPDIGGEPSTPVCIFVNGSFWTYAFAEEGMDANHISKALKTPCKQLVTALLDNNVAIGDIKKMGLTPTPLGNSIYSIDGFLNKSPIFYAYFDTLRFKIDTTDPGYDRLALETFCNTVLNSPDSILASGIDRESFYRYTLSAWFFQNYEESWTNRVSIAKAGALPWKIFAQHYDFTTDSTEANDAYKYFSATYGQKDKFSKQTLPWRAMQRMLAYDRDYFCLVLEDELNTTYQPARTVAIAQKKIASLRPCISECSRAWWPNDWIDSLNWETSVAGIVPFLNERPLVVAGALPKIFLHGIDTSLTLSDRNEVTVKFDEAPGNEVKVMLNSLEIGANFSGKYFPKPELRIALKFDHAKYKFIKWLEYPKAPESFNLSANQKITLTPVVKLR